MRIVIVLVVAFLFGCSDSEKDKISVGVTLSKDMAGKYILDEQSRVLMRFNYPDRNDTVWIDWEEDWGKKCITESYNMSGTRTKRTHTIVDGARI